jgi:hypothetical protein
VQRSTDRLDEHVEVFHGFLPLAPRCRTSARARFDARRSLFRAFAGDRRKGRAEDDGLMPVSTHKAQRCHLVIPGTSGRPLHRLLR